MLARVVASAKPVAPGLAAAAGVAGTAALVASALPSSLHISAIPVSIAIGALAANVGPLATEAAAKALKPGISLATSTVLRAGIVCVGAKLSAAQVLALGWTTIPAAACSVGAGVFLIPRLAAYAGLAPRLGALLAAGTSICGVTAISAVAPAIGATTAEVAVAVANVVAFGSVGMLVYPHVAHALFPPDDSGSIGLFLGLAVHDTAQVMGAAASYAEQYIPRVEPPDPAPAACSPGGHGFASRCRYADTAVVAAAAVAKLTRNVYQARPEPASWAARRCAHAGRDTFASSYAQQASSSAPPMDRCRSSWLASCR